MNEIYARITDLCKQRGITGFRLCKEVGLQPSLLTDLKAGRQSSISYKKAAIIADYFGVSVDYLLSGKEDKGLYRNIEMLCLERGITVTKLCVEANVSRSSITDLKMGRIKDLSRETAKKIADYLGVTIAELYEEEPQSLPITMIARAGKKMTPQQQETLLKFAQFTFPEAFKDEN